MLFGIASFPLTILATAHGRETPDETAKPSDTEIGSVAIDEMLQHTYAREVKLLIILIPIISDVGSGIGAMTLAKNVRASEHPSQYGLFVLFLKLATAAAILRRATDMIARSAVMRRQQDFSGRSPLRGLTEAVLPLLEAGLGNEHVRNA